MVKDAASMRPRLPLSRGLADEFRPAKTHEFSRHREDDAKGLLGLFSQGNRGAPRGNAAAAQEGSNPNERKARLSSHQHRKARKSQGEGKSSEPPPSPRWKRKKAVVKPELSTFDELTIAASKIADKFEELTTVSALWEGHDKSEARQQQAGLIKDANGNWRDIDGVLVESASAQEDNERQKAKSTIAELFKELGSGEKVLRGVLTRFSATMKESSSEVDGDITEMYPVFAATIGRENRRRLATLTPVTPKYDSTLGLERELASVAKPSTIRVKVEMLKKKEEETLHKIHNRIQEYGLEEVSKVHRDEKFHVKKHTIIGGDKLQGGGEEKQVANNKSRAETISLNEEDSKLFQKQVQLAMLKGQYTEKKEIVETQGGSTTRNQEELEQLYIKAAEMKVKHLLEVIDRQQDQMSNIGHRFEQLDVSVVQKEEFLDKTIEDLRLRAKGMVGKKIKEKEAEAEAANNPGAASKEKKKRAKKGGGKAKKAKKAVKAKKGKEGEEKEAGGAGGPGGMDKIAEEGEEEGDEGENKNNEDEDEDDDDDDDDVEEEEDDGNVDRRKEWNKGKAEQEIQAKMKENEELERENQVLMEQLERVTNFKVGGSGGDALIEVVEECEKARKLQTIKENRLRRLKAAHEDKKFNVDNARTLAIKAQKDRIEGEIKSMEEEARQLEQDKLFARYCKETFVIAKNMAAGEVERLGAVAQDEEGKQGGGEEGGGGGALTRKMLQTANALMSVENINQELKASSVVVDFAAIELTKNDKDIEKLLRDMERLEDCQIEGGDDSKAKGREGEADEKASAGARPAEEGKVVEEQMHRVTEAEENTEVKTTPEKATHGKPKRRTSKQPKRSQSQYHKGTPSPEKKLRMTKEERDAKISEINEKISKISVKRVEIVHKLNSSKQTMLTLRSLKKEGNKRLHHDNVKQADIEKYQNLALLHSKTAMVLEDLLGYLDDKSLLKKRLNYVKAKQHKLKSIVDSDPNKKDSKLSGMMNNASDEKQLKDISMMLKGEIKSLSDTVKAVVGEKKKKASTFEERKLLRQLKSEHSSLSKKWEKYEASGGSALAAFKENRQIRTLQSKKVETKRKIETLRKRIQRALGLHDKELREQQERRKAKGEDRQLSTKEQDIISSIKNFKKQAIWWKRRLGEVETGKLGAFGALSGLSGTSGAGSSSPASTTSPKGFASKLAERANKRRLSRALTLSGGQLEALRTEADANEKEKALPEAVQERSEWEQDDLGEDKETLPGNVKEALQSINNVVADDAANRWKKKAEVSRAAGEFEERTLTPTKAAALVARNPKGVGSWLSEGGRSISPTDLESNTVALSSMATSPTSPKSRSPMALKRRNTTMNLWSKGNEKEGEGKEDAFAKMNEILSKLKEERKKKDDTKLKEEEEKKEKKTDGPSMAQGSNEVSKDENLVIAQEEMIKDPPASPTPTKPSTPKVPFSNYANRKSTLKNSKVTKAVEYSAKRPSGSVKIEAENVEAFSLATADVATDEEYNTSGDNETKMEAENIVRKLSSSLSPSFERTVESRFSDHQKKLSCASAGAGAFIGGTIKRGTKRGSPTARGGENILDGIFVSAGGVGKGDGDGGKGSGNDDLKSMLERDLKSQLEQQQRNRESLLKLAKAGGSFQDKEDIPDASVQEGQGAQRISNAAKNILFGMKEQRLMQTSMGSFSQLGGILSVGVGEGEESQQQRLSLTEVASRIGKARTMPPLLSQKKERNQSFNSPLSSPKGPVEGSSPQMVKKSLGKGKEMNPFAN